MEEQQGNIDCENYIDINTHLTSHTSTFQPSCVSVKGARVEYTMSRQEPRRRPLPSIWKVPPDASFTRRFCPPRAQNTNAFFIWRLKSADKHRRSRGREKNENVEKEEHHNTPFLLLRSLFERGKGGGVERRRRTKGFLNFIQSYY